MKINRKIGKFFRDVYLYDFKSCYFNTMKSLGLDVSNVEEEDKRKRNIQIGWKQKGNKSLADTLFVSATNTVDAYIQQNSLDESEVIVKQKDGFISTRKLERDNLFTKLDLRERIIFLIVGYDRKEFLLLTDDGKIIVKGIPNRYEEMNKYYNRFKLLDTNSKINLFNFMNNIYEEIINSNSISTFLIPKNNNKVSVIFKQWGEVLINSTSSKIIDPKDINKVEYFIRYLSPFTKSLFEEFA